LTEPERVLFRRLAAFLGGFELPAARAVAGHDEVERFQVLDLLTLLVDKSLVVADNSGGRTRYRLLETVRQYALEKLGESGEADSVRSRHRDYYTALAAVLDAPAGGNYEQGIEQAEIEIDNLRAAFGWSLELALALASALWPLWQARGRLREGLPGWPGSTRPSPTSTPSTLRRWHPRCGHGRSPTTPRSLSGCAARVWIGPNRRWRLPATSTTRPCWPGRWPPAAIPPFPTPSWRGSTSPRRSTWPAR
jgi:hypothetical protein